MSSGPTSVLTTTSTTMRTPTLQPVPESLPADHVSSNNGAGSESRTSASAKKKVRILVYFKWCKIETLENSMSSKLCEMKKCVLILVLCEIFISLLKNSWIQNNNVMDTDIMICFLKCISVNFFAKMEFFNDLKGSQDTRTPGLFKSIQLNLLKLLW